MLMLDSELAQRVFPPLPEQIPQLKILIPVRPDRFGNLSGLFSFL
jgi:hypothetical protein